jgi:SAM-dependent methyltransferase
MIKWLLPILLIFWNLPLAAEETASNYALAIGEEDKTRLTIINEIYNPFSFQFLHKCQIAPGDRVLELGCGIGLVSQQLALLVSTTGSVLATDISEEQLAIAKSLLSDPVPKNLKFQQLSVFDVDKLNEKFDIVYVRFLLMHIPDLQKVIRQVKNVLQPGGKFIIEDCVGNHTVYSIPHSKGMDAVKHFDQLQFELQKSDDQSCSKLPSLLQEEGFNVTVLPTIHPKLDSPRKRKMLTDGISSLKTALLMAKKITLEEYNLAYSAVQDLENDLSIEVYGYETGQICATLQ